MTSLQETSKGGTGRDRSLLVDVLDLVTDFLVVDLLDVGDLDWLVFLKQRSHRHELPRPL